MADETLYIGVDLGTFRSVMVSSDGHDEKVLTVIGTPKDQIACLLYTSPSPRDS